MMGHMESASALGALFKIVRSMQTGMIHKVVGFTDYHPEMDRASQPCAIATETSAWPRTGGPRLAGMHCYGMGGTNAHLLIEEFDRHEYQPGHAGPGREEGRSGDRDEPEPVLIVLSAGSEACLTAMVGQLYEFLNEEAHAPQSSGRSDATSSFPKRTRLVDIAFPLQVGR